MVNRYCYEAKHHSLGGIHLLTQLWSCTKELPAHCRLSGAAIKKNISPSVLFPFVRQPVIVVNYDKITQPTGFEPVRGDPNWFRVNRLNHSATTAVQPDRLVKKLAHIILTWSPVRECCSENGGKDCAYSCVSLSGCSSLTTKLRIRQDSNLCGQSPMDFKSIALTTRPRMQLIDNSKNSCNQPTIDRQCPPRGWLANFCVLCSPAAAA